MEDPTRPRLTVWRFALHLAPTALAWAYVAWLFAAWRTRSSLLVDLFPLQLAVAFFSFWGGIFATRLPVSKRWRVLLILASIAAALVLVALGVPVQAINRPSP